MIFFKPQIKKLLQQFCQTIPNSGQIFFQTMMMGTSFFYVSFLQVHHHFQSQICMLFLQYPCDRRWFLDVWWLGPSWFKSQFYRTNNQKPLAMKYVKQKWIKLQICSGDLPFVYRRCCWRKGHSVWLNSCPKRGCMVIYFSIEIRING